MIKNNAKELVPDIKYEFQMFNWAYDKASYSSNENYEKNAYIECFLIHTRNLVDFFVKPTNSMKDDVLARDFFQDDALWINQESAICKYTVSQRTDINKTLAHLTYERKNPKLWDLKSMYDEIANAQTQFFEQLESEQKSWFR